MRWQLLDIDQLQPVPRCHRVDRDQREIREMLVIDRVELVFLDQFFEVGEFQGHDAFRLQKAGDSGDEIIEIGNLGQDVVARNEIGAAPFGDELFGEADAEEVDNGLDTFRAGRLGDIGRRLDADGRDTEGHKMLKQIAVIARKLDNQAVLGQGEPLGDHLAVGLGVRDPARGERREVGIGRENMVGRHIFLQLDEEAGVAHHDPKRVEGLHLIELGGIEEAFAQGRHAEIDEGPAKCRSAEPATRQLCSSYIRSGCEGQRHAVHSLDRSKVGTGKRHIRFRPTFSRARHRAGDRGVVAA